MIETLLSLKHEISLGLVHGVEFVPMFGRNLDVDVATTPEDFWEGSAVYSGFVDTPDTLEFFSDNVADDADGGTGAHTILVWGVDDQYDYAEDVITLDGVTPVQSSVLFRTSEVKVLTAGSGGKNAGTITCRQVGTPANVLFKMPVGRNRTHVCAKTIPRNHVGLVVGASVRAVRTLGSLVSGNLVTREFGSVWVVERNFVATDTSDYVESFGGGILVRGKGEVKLEILESSANNLEAIGSIDLFILSDNVSFPLAVRPVALENVI